MRKIGLYIFLLFTVFACKKNEDFGPQYANETPTEIEKVLKGVLVINEGNFGFGNSSLSVIDFQKQSIQNKVFENVNNKQLGDVAQSVLVVDSLAFVVVNNSNLIFVIGLNDFKIIKEIKVSGAPRYLAKYKNEILLSSMGANSLQSISLNDFSISTKVSISNWGWLEEMVVIENKISQGSSATELVFQFSDIENSPTRLRLSGNGNKVYFLNNGVFEFDLMNKNEPIILFPQKSGQLFYGLGVNPSTGGLFVSNAKDYVSEGEVLELTENGTIARSFDAGIIPQGFGFY